MKYYFSVLLAAIFLLPGCNSSTKNQQNPTAISIIFETDIGNDVDDVLALDMLYKYSDRGAVNFLGVSTNKVSPYSIEFLDLMKTWYGYPKQPMGKITQGVDYELNDENNYIKTTCLYQENGKSPFKRTHQDYERIPESPLFYRELLAKQPDNSVVVVSVGFSTNIARLLDTRPDQFSPLAGKELVAKKVKLLSLMGGNIADVPDRYNIGLDIPAAQKIVNEWPTPIVMSPAEVGTSILFPATVIENNLAYANPNPLKIAYESFLEMPYDRPTWDLTSVLYAVEGEKNYFNISEWGRIEVDDEAYTRFYPDKNGRHAYLSINKEQAEIIKNRFVELISFQPQIKK